MTDQSDRLSARAQAIARIQPMLNEYVEPGRVMVRVSGAREKGDTAAMLVGPLGDPDD